MESVRAVEVCTYLVIAPKNPGDLPKLVRSFIVSTVRSKLVKNIGRLLIDPEPSPQSESKTYAVFIPRRTILIGLKSWQKRLELCLVSSPSHFPFGLATL